MFFGACDERNPHNKRGSSSSRSSTASCASRGDTKNLALANSEDYRDKRCIAWEPLHGRSKPHSLFFGPADALLAACSFLCQFFRAGVVTSFRLHIFKCALLTTALWVSRIRRKALKHTAVYRLRESSLPLKCAVRCTHRPVLVVLHAACLCCWLFVFCRLDSSPFPNGHVILEK